MEMSADLLYSKDHEWVRVESDGVAVIGVTDFAAEQLGDVVYVDLPEVGETIDAEATFGEIESTKSVSDLFAPIAGEVVAVNEDLADAPETVNSDPYGAGWLIEVRPSDAADLEGLLSAADYEAEIA